MAEFDYEGKPKETFPFDQSMESRSMYYLAEFEKAPESDRKSDK